MPISSVGLNPSGFAPGPLSPLSSPAPAPLRPPHLALAGLPARTFSPRGKCPAPTRGPPGGRRPGPTPRRPVPPGPATQSHGWEEQPARGQDPSDAPRSGPGNPCSARAPAPPPTCPRPQVPPPTLWGRAAWRPRPHRESIPPPEGTPARGSTLYR